MSRKPELYFAVLRSWMKHGVRVVGVTSEDKWKKHFWGREYAHGQSADGATHGRLSDIIARHATLAEAEAGAARLRARLPVLDDVVERSYEAYQYEIRKRDLRMAELAGAQPAEDAA